MNERIAARGHGLRLHGRRIRMALRSHLQRYHAAQIVIDPHDIHDHHAGVAAEEREISAIGLAADAEQPAARRPRIERALGPHGSDAVRPHRPNTPRRMFDRPHLTAARTRHHRSVARGQHQSVRRPDARCHCPGGKQHANRRVARIAHTAHIARRAAE
jgi:hypothetical protein